MQLTCVAAAEEEEDRLVGAVVGLSERAVLGGRASMSRSVLSLGRMEMDDGVERGWMSVLWMCSMSATMVVEEEACEREGRLGICRRDRLRDEVEVEVEVDEEKVERGRVGGSLRTQATEKGWFIHHERAGK